MIYYIERKSPNVYFQKNNNIIISKDFNAYLFIYLFHHPLVIWK